MGGSRNMELIYEGLMGFDQDMSEMKSDIAELKQDVSELKQDMVIVKSDISELKQRTGALESDVRDIKLVLENDIKKSIQIIAEGHIDLVRKLDEALKINQEKEMDHLRLIRLENEVRQIREGRAVLA